MSDESYVRVPSSAMRWLMGEGENFAPDPGQNGAYWWRSEFRRRIKIGQPATIAKDYYYRGDGIDIPAGAPASPALDRASIPAMFNVVGDELRKLNVIVCDLNAHIESIEQELVGSMRLLHSRIGAIEARLSDLKIIEPAVARIESQLSTFKDGTYERINLLATDNEKMQAQLTALRAEADKRREPMLQKMDSLHEITTHELIAIRNWIGKVADVQALIPNGLKALAVDIDQQSAIKFEGLEERIGYMFGALAKEMHRRARKKKQERKRGKR